MPSAVLIPHEKLGNRALCMNIIQSFHHLFFVYFLVAWSFSTFIVSLCNYYYVMCQLFLSYIVCSFDFLTSPLSPHVSFISTIHSSLPCIIYNSMISRSFSMSTVYRSSFIYYFLALHFIFLSSVIVSFYHNIGNFPSL